MHIIYQTRVDRCLSLSYILYRSSHISSTITGYVRAVSLIQSSPINYALNRKFKYTHSAKLHNSGVRPCHCILKLIIFFGFKINFIWYNNRWYFLNTESSSGGAFARAAAVDRAEREKERRGRGHYWFPGRACWCIIKQTTQRTFRLSTGP